MAQNSSRKSIWYPGDSFQNGGITERRDEYESVSTLSVKRYGGSLIQMVKLSGMEQILLGFLTEVMDNNNLVLHNTRLRDKFQQYLSHSEMEPISDRHIRTMMSVLGRSIFLIPTKKKGEFYLNPLFFAKSDASRERLISKLCAEKIIKRPKPKK